MRAHRWAQPPAPAHRWAEARPRPPPSQPPASRRPPPASRPRRGTDLDREGPVVGAVVVAAGDRGSRETGGHALHVDERLPHLLQRRVYLKGLLELHFGSPPDRRVCPHRGRSTGGRTRSYARY